MRIGGGGERELLWIFKSGRVSSFIVEQIVRKGGLGIVGGVAGETKRNALGAVYHVAWSGRKRNKKKKKYLRR